MIEFFLDLTHSIKILLKTTIGPGESACQKHNIGGYPTLKAFVNGKVIDYDGERDMDAFKSWLKSKEPADEL